MMSTSATSSIWLEETWVPAPLDDGDVVSRWLNELRSLGAFIVDGAIAANSGVVFPGEDCPTLHMVREGTCDIRSAYGVFHLEPGDLFLMQSGFQREVRHGQSPRIVPMSDLIPMTIQTGRITRFSTGEAVGSSKVFGFATCFGEGPHTALQALPPVSLLKAADLPPGLTTQIDLLLGENNVRHLPSPLIIARQAEVIFLMALRSVLEAQHNTSPLILAARDPNLRRALYALHADLRAPWTVPSLSRIAGMSRSAFSAAFGELVGLPPMKYLTQIRMRHARGRLLCNETVKSTADTVGYQSATAFSAAFKRHWGVAPKDVTKISVDRDADLLRAY